MIKYPVVLIIKKRILIAKAVMKPCNLSFIIFQVTYIDTNGLTLTDKMANVDYILLFVWVFVFL